MTGWTGSPYNSDHVRALTREGLQQLGEVLHEVHHTWESRYSRMCNSFSVPVPHICTYMI